ncbi:MAG: hypothetical protein JW934_07785 [Anaerolineae bacterium]|nr:hypothetical protein [Anaerolineae bacterium]
MSGKERIVLDGIDRYQVVDPLYECVRVVLNHRGESYSPAYIQGLSGAAFRIGGICPCAPTCDCAMSTQDLIALLGYEMTYLPLYGDENQSFDLEQEAARVIARIKDEIRAGRPAIVWHAFTTAEWDVVAGFDDEQGLFFGRGSYAGIDGYAQADQKRLSTCRDICPALGAILVGEKIGQFNAREAEIAALQEAVRHAHSTEGQDQLSGDKWVMLHGLLCYDRWIDDWRKPERKRTAGDSYCLGVYRSTHRIAAGFMSELALKYPQAQSNFERAAAAFTAEADALDAAVPLLWWSAPEDPDPERNARLVPLLRQARDGYARGIDAIEAALVVVEFG